jgi:hypothetical protein
MTVDFVEYCRFATVVVLLSTTRLRMVLHFVDLLILLQFAGSDSMPVLAGYTKHNIPPSQKAVALRPRRHRLWHAPALHNPPGIPPRSIVDCHILPHNRLASCLDVHLV